MLLLKIVFRSSEYSFSKPFRNFLPRFKNSSLEFTGRVEERFFDDGGFDSHQFPICNLDVQFVNRPATLGIHKLIGAAEMVRDVAC